jgi:hypothetical protein
MQPDTQATEVSTEVNPRYADFESDSRVDVKEEAKAEPVIEKVEETESDDVEESGEEETVEGETKPKKRGGSFQKKIARLKAESEAKDAEIAALKAKVTPQSEHGTQELKKPNPEDFTDWQEYENAKESYLEEKATIKALERLEAKLQEKESKKEAEVKVNSFNVRQEEARKAHEDFDDVVDQYKDTKVRAVIVDLIVESELGAELQYHIASNPELFEKLNSNKLTDIQLARELGIIEASLQGKKQGKPAVKTTNAPAPISPVKPRVVAANTPEAAAKKGDYESYRKARGLD